MLELAKKPTSDKEVNTCAVADAVMTIAKDAEDGVYEPVVESNGHGVLVAVSPGCG